MFTSQGVSPCQVLVAGTLREGEAPGRDLEEGRQGVLGAPRARPGADGTEEPESESEECLGSFFPESPIYPSRFR